MTLFWDNEMGQPIFMLDQLTMHLTVNTVYKHFGVHGILYAICFYWEGSPYVSGEDDLERRHLQVLSNTCRIEQFDIFRNEMMNPPTKSNQPHYQNANILQAGKDLNILAAVPELAQARWNRIQIEQLRKKAEINWTIVEDKELKDKLAIQKAVLANIADMEKTYNANLAAIKDKMKKEVSSSLDIFISKDGQLEDSDPLSRNGKLEISEG